MATEKARKLKVSRRRSFGKIFFDPYWYIFAILGLRYD
jgi:hypothetical protein